MNYWETILLGLIQGIAEFLPISSSGHLVIFESLLGGSSENLELNVALHFGTLMSILLVYRNDFIGVLFNPKLVLAIIIATLPVVVVGYFSRTISKRSLPHRPSLVLDFCLRRHFCL